MDWDQVFQSQNSSHPELLNADLYAKEHIQEFLNGYGLKLDYELEHKLDHTASQIFYIKKAHYIMEKFENGEIIYKVRGTSERENPIYLQLAKQFFQKNRMMNLEDLEDLEDLVDLECLKSLKRNMVQQEQEQEDHEVQELEVKEVKELEEVIQEVKEEVFQLESTVRRLSSIHD